MKALFVLAALLVSASAQAARPNTQNMTAAQTKELVAQNGAIVLSTSSFGYDRFVANQSFCASGERAVAAYVPTLDSDAAFIGYSCVSHARGDTALSKRYPATATVCREGKTQSFSESRANGLDGQENILRVCVSGKWKRLYGADPVGPKKILCKEGSYRTEQVSKAGNSDRFDNVTKVCRDGKWYSVN
jgi:hypothetical protein